MRTSSQTMGDMRKNFVLHVAFLVSIYISVLMLCEYEASNRINFSKAVFPSSGKIMKLFLLSYFGIVLFSFTLARAGCETNDCGMGHYDDIGDYGAQVYCNGEFFFSLNVTHCSDGLPKGDDGNCCGVGGEKPNEQY